VAALGIVQGIAEKVVRGLELRDAYAHFAGAVGLAVEKHVRAFEDQRGAALLVETQFPEDGPFAEEIGPQVEIGDQNLDILGAGQVGQGRGVIWGHF